MRMIDGLKTRTSLAVGPSVDEQPPTPVSVLTTRDEALYIRMEQLAHAPR